MAQPPPTQHTVELYKAETLGVGSYGAVCKARCNELLCAAKILHPVMFQFNDPGALDFLHKFKQECQFLHTINHPNIVQYLASTRDPETGLPVLLMELMDESLTSFLERSQQPLPYHTQVNLCHDIALALAYLHSNRIIHQNLSSNNVLLIAGGRAKVADFDMSKLIDTNQRMTPLTKCPGTLVYMSPEALRKHPVYSEKLDCFSEGVLTIQIMTRQFPNPGPSMRMIEGPHYPLGRIHVPVPEAERRRSHIVLIDPTHPLLPLALRCLEYNEEDRPSAQELCRSLATLKEATKYTQSLSLKKAQERGIRAGTERRERQIHDLQQQVKTLQQRVQEKDQQLLAKDQQLRAKDTAIAEKERGTQVSTERRERQIHDLQQQVKTLQQRVQEKDQQLLAKDQQLRAKDTAIAEKERGTQVSTERRERQIHDLQQQVKTLQQRVQEKDQSLLAKDRQLRAKDTAIAEKERGTQANTERRERQIHDLQQQVKTLQQRVQEKDQQLLAKVRQLRAKDIAKERGTQANTERRERQIHESQQQVKTLQQRVQEKDQQLLAKNTVIAENVRGNCRPRRQLQEKQQCVQQINRQHIWLIRSLGEGRFGEVWEGMWDKPPSVRVAVRSLNPGSMSPPDFLQKASLMNEFCHPKMIQLYGVCRGEPIYIITEYMKHGSLLEFLHGDGRALKFPRLVDMSAQVAAGMAYLEQQKCIHCNLAARNILVGEHHVCKIDHFGLICASEGYTHEAFVGTRFVKWMAPEAVLNNRFTIKSDVWSFGILLHEIITYGRIPYPGMTNAQVVEGIKQGYRMSRPLGCPQEFYDIVQSCWKEEPKTRPTFETLQWQLEEFFVNI